MSPDAEAYLRRETAAALRSLQIAKTAWQEKNAQELEKALRAYVLHRFSIFETADPAENDIDRLAELSIQFVYQLSGGDLEAAGMITGCGSSTTPLYKKVQLLFTLQKAFDVHFDPERIPYLRTLPDLAAELMRLLPASALPAQTPSDQDEAEVRLIRNDFPCFSRDPEMPVYLDNAATMMVPAEVLQAVAQFYTDSYANVHRGIYQRADKATRGYESARTYLAGQLGISPEELIFTAGATAGLNTAAYAFQPRIHRGDRIVTTEMEHHSNYLPWLELCQRTGASLAVVPVNAQGDLDLDVLDALLRPPTVLLAFTQCSNVTGALTPVEAICRKAHEAGIFTVVDGAQGIRHTHGSLQSLCCDCYAFSGHKVMSGSGIGILYMRKDVLAELSSPVVGGGTIEAFQADEPLYYAAPAGWEAGTPNLAGAIALEAAFRYSSRIGHEWIEKRENAMLAYLRRGLAEIPGTAILGSPRQYAGCISFTIEGMSAADISAVLNLKKIAVRSGHHCAIPLHRHFHQSASVRISPAFYNTYAELDQALQAIRDIAVMGKSSL